MRRLVVAKLGLASAVAASATATQGPLPTLSLVEARRIAFERNWDLLAARSGVETAVAQRIVAREFPNPGFSLSTTQISVNGSGNATVRGNGVWDRSYDTIAAINQLFEVGGKRAARRSSAQAAVAAAEARLLDARRVLESGVTQAYVAALLASTKADILRQSAASLRREAGIAEIRFTSGDISRADKTQIEIAAERLELDAISAENDAFSSRLAVDILLGENSASGKWTPTDSLDGLARPASDVPLPGATDRPDLIAARADVAKAEADLRLQRAQRVPDPTLLLQYEHQPPDFGESVGIGISLPLPLWNHNVGGIRAATATRDQALQQQRRLEAQIAAERVIAEHNYTSAAEKLRRQREQIEPKSAEVRRSVSLAYERGGASLLELLAAERNDSEIRLGTAQAAADAATAHSTLRAALNVSQSDLNSTTSR